MDRALYVVILVCLAVLACPVARAEPPFSGTIFIHPDIITASDPTTFVGLTPAGQGMRLMFDRRVNSFIDLNAFLFNATFSDGLRIEIQVNPEFGEPDAERQAQEYAPVIGRLPTVLRSQVQTVWIHQGVQPFGGGNNNLLLHTGQADLYAASGILEETLVHEAAHTSLDGAHANAAGWLAAQRADPDFISTYARDNPTREDVAESFLPYFAVRYRSDRIPAALANTITATIPNRMAYFDAQKFEVLPQTGEIPPIACASEPALRSRESTTLTSIQFRNETSQPRWLLWLDFNGAAQRYAILEPGVTLVQATYLTHPWMVTNAAGGCLGVYLPTATPGRVILRD